MRSCQCTETSIRISELVIIDNKAIPKIEPETAPSPPLRLAPPITAAEIAVISLLPGAI